MENDKVTIEGFPEAGGINYDMPETSLQNAALSWGKNIRMHDGGVGNINCGYELWKDLGTDIPIHIAWFQDAESNVFWTYVTDTKIMVIDPDPLTQLNVANPLTAATDVNTCVIAAVPVFNSYTNAPLYWPQLDPLVALVKLPWHTAAGPIVYNWDQAYDYSAMTYTAQYRAKVIRSHGNFLFAINIKHGLQRLPVTVHCSDAAEPGFPPSSWKYDEVSNLSRRFHLSETQGVAVDGLTLGDSFLVYKTDGVWRFDFVESNDIVFRKKRIRTLPGALATDCVVEIEGQHVVLSSTDIYIHNGQNKRSLIDDRNRRLLSLIAADKTNRCFLVKNSQYKEVWVCIAKEGDIAYPVLAAVWSWRYDAWTERELPTVTCAMEGPTQSPGRVLINNAVGKTVDDHRLINQVTINPRNIHLLAGRLDNEIVKYDTGPLNAGAPFESIVRRLRLMVDVEANDAVTRVYPQARWYGGSTGLELRFGSHAFENDPVNWEKYLPFDVLYDRYVSPHVSGAYLAYEVKGSGVGWSLHSLDANITHDGER